jgi:uncharacterized membrane protein
MPVNSAAPKFFLEVIVMKLSALARWTCAAALGSAALLGDVPAPQFSAGSDNPITIGEAAHAKRSGGRSGGGSIGRSSSRRSSQPTRTVSPRVSSSSRRINDYNRHTVIVADLDTRPSSRGSSNNWLGLLVVGGTFGTIVGFKAVTALGNAAAALKDVDFSSLERTNDIVTVSALQVAILINDDHDLQTELSNISLTADTSQSKGLADLLQNTALTTLRFVDQWCYGSGSSSTLSNREQATACFNTHSLEERSTFSDESLVNIDGSLNQNSATSDGSNDGKHVVVTFIVATEADRPLFQTIKSREDLQIALTRLAALPTDYLLRVEMLWSPQAAPEGLTQDELLVNYPDLLPL